MEPKHKRSGVEAADSGLAALFGEGRDPGPTMSRAGKVKSGRTLPITSNSKPHRDLSLRSGVEPECRESDASRAESKHALLLGDGRAPRWRKSATRSGKSSRTVLRADDTGPEVVKSVAEGGDTEPDRFRPEAGSIRPARAGPCTGIGRSGVK